MAGKYGEHNKVRCSFCNKSEDQVRKLIAGPEGVYICDECIEICAEIIDEELDEYYEQDENQSGINLMKPKEITAFLDDYVIGQDEAKKTLAVAVYNHYKRITVGKRVDGVELSFADDAIEEVADKTLERKTGARGLRAIMEKAMLDIMYNLPSDENVESCLITKDVIDGSGEPVLMYSDDGKLPSVKTKKSKKDKEIEETA